MKGFFKWNMLVTSFVPLWISIILIIAWDTMAVKYSSLPCLFRVNAVQLIFAAVIVIMLMIAVASVLAFIRLKGKPNEGSGVGRIISARKSTSLITDFLLSYILPMIAFDFTGVRDIVLFLIYFMLIAFLSIRNGNVYTNVLFEFMGYKLFDCDIERNIAGAMFTYNDCTIISRENFTGKIGQEFSFFDFDNNIYININLGKGAHK